MAMNEPGASLNDENDPIYNSLLDENGDPMIFVVESGSELDSNSESDADSQSDADTILMRAVQETEAKKRSERSSSFDYGFDIPASIRKKIVRKKINPKNKKIGKENWNKDHTTKQSKSPGRGQKKTNQCKDTAVLPNHCEIITNMMSARKGKNEERNRLYQQRSIVQIVQEI